MRTLRVTAKERALLLTCWLPRLPRTLSIDPGCFDLEFTPEVCCSDPPGRRDCWRPDQALTFENCCSRANDGVDYPGVVETLRGMLNVVDRLSGGLLLPPLQSCRGFLASLMEVLGSIPELGRETALLQQWLATRPAAEKRRHAELCNDQLHRLHNQLILIDSVTAAHPKVIPYDRLCERMASVGKAARGILEDRSARLWAQEAAAKRPLLGFEGAVHIAMVASVGKPPFGPKVMATIRSALFFARSRPLAMHLIVDGPGAVSVGRALTLLEPWLRERGSFHLRDVTSLPHVWKLIHATVAQDCLHSNSRYGSPGWLRMFPEEVFNRLTDPEVVIWVDAGDYIFLDDPAKLLSYVDELAPAQVALAPQSHHLPFQIFHLPRLRQSMWRNFTKTIVREKYASLGREHFCFLGEGRTMTFMVAEHPELWRMFPSNWAYEPWAEGRLGYGVTDFWSPHEPRYPCAPSIWREMAFPGVHDFLHMRIACLTLEQSMVDALLHSNGPSRTQLGLRLAMKLHHTWATNASFEDWKGQELECGGVAAGVHFVSPFHELPWAWRFMNFWAGADVWGKNPWAGRDLRV